jgi:hypothetical protein
MAGFRSDGRPSVSDRGPAFSAFPGVYFLSMGIDNKVDWTASATPQGEQYGPGLSRKAAKSKAAAGVISKHAVMDKLLGDNKLAAFDAGGGDPYNATGRQFRR